MATLSYLTTTYFDFGAIKRLAKVLSVLGVGRPMIATDRGVVAAGIVAKAESQIGSAALVFDETPENPTEAAVDAAVAEYRRADCDGVVAIGGGSGSFSAKRRAHGR